MHDYQPHVSRRTTLKWVAGALTLAVLPGRSGAKIFQPTPGGYGTDPNLALAQVPWPRLMNSHELNLVAAVGDLILPATASARAPSALGVPEFIDEWISAPYPQQLEDRRIVRGGLAWIDRAARERSGVEFLRAPVAEQVALLTLAIPQAGQKPADPSQIFGARIRALVVGGYYSTDVGARELGYVGNVPLAAYPEPSAEMTAFLEAACQRLGI
jgi:hypothetical protein